MTDRRDMRDPEQLGLRYLFLRRPGERFPIATCVNSWAPSYDPGPWISAPPHEHHLAGTDLVKNRLLTSNINLSDGAD